MKRMAALLAVMAAVSGVVPATAFAAEKDKSVCSMFFVLRFC